MHSGNKDKFIIIPLYEPTDSASKGPARATGHALIQRGAENRPAISVYYPGEIYSGEPEIAIFAPQEDTGLALKLNLIQSGTRGLKRFTGFLNAEPGELNNNPLGLWNLRVYLQEGETLLEGKFNFLEVSELTEQPSQESTTYASDVDEFDKRVSLPGELFPLQSVQPLQPVQPLANPLPNHLWWSIKCWERFM